MAKKILFAVSDENFHAQAEGFFQREEFILLHARNTQETMDLVAEEEPALVLLNQDLSPLGGDACCRAIKKDYLLRHVRLALLVSPEDQDSERCRDSGADEIITWPVAWSDLLTSARRLLNLPDPGRLSLRADLHLPVKFRRLPKEDHHKGTTVNLSTGGFFVDTQKLYPRDSLLEIELDLSSVGQPPLKGRARVAWVNHPEWINKPQMPGGMGLELVDPPLDVLVQLEMLVAQVLTCAAES